MKISTLLKMYPNSRITNKKTCEEEYLVIFDGYQYLEIPREDLTENECLLLQNIFDKPLEMSIWHEYLVIGSPLTDVEIHQVQLIHFIIDNTDFKSEWLASFSRIFEYYVDGFFLEVNYGVVIVERQTYSDEEILGLLNALEEDYSVSTKIFIGSLVDKEILREVFKEEKNMFKKQGSKKRINNFINTYIEHYMVSSVEQSKTCQSIKEKIAMQKYLPELIKSLWENQGNQSAVAKDIFVHRNTINYRIDKFYEEFGLDLRDMEQLFLAYLLIK